ncbi:molybdenum cofactor biosynthesis protein MoaE [Advenella sp. S44]|uniref:molybdenum cofactor biosynthesis protein MoaE n=1 Tax=Advenella sp. S44 TaxID=1982755 RepID=UPI000C29DDFF|nr:molybdenum cofactor biosynthesis protein MoaE [Advenella sp. S44]PJX25848.1 molybdenum cofactor biosynthesis protein MoaE [Advenella sp. S44]
MIIVQQADFDAGQLIAGLHRRTQGQAGAVASFVGYVRDYSADQQTQELFLEHYPGMCEQELSDIAQQAAQRWDIIDSTIVHRVGALSRQQQIVFVGVASAHRGDAFAACEFIMDALKTRAPFWKRETLSDGKAFWVEARSSDQQSLEKWTHPDNAPQDNTAGSK